MSMKTRTSIYALAFAMSALLALPTTAPAAQCDCGQPSSNGSSPTATDCLLILNVAVGLRACGPPCDDCVCDVNGDGSTSATDALGCLKTAVGTPGLLNCNCATGCADVPPKNACSGADFFSLPTSDLDAGWNGLGHNATIPTGASISFAIVRRCNGDGAVCDVDADCGAGETCDFTCDCDCDSSPACEVTGPTSGARCIVETNIVCTTNADCPGEQDCVKFFGPPLPLVASGTPTCVATFFQEDITGTADPVTGEGEIVAKLRSRVHLGVSPEQPCPRCGRLDQSPVVGQSFTCELGPRDGQACTVDAVSEVWGGLSSDCPPAATSNFSGTGLVIDFSRVSTGEVSRQATLPCGNFAALHPSSGTAVCLDNFTACNTNADCTRCVGKPTVECTSNGDCGADGPCAAAPDQPFSCGLYCHCGFCNGDTSRPCFGDDQCGGDTCTTDVEAQDRANNCNDFVCGVTESGGCCSADDGAACATPTAKVGECSIATYVNCDTNADCAAGEGTCNLGRAPCFGNVLTRTGRGSTIGSYCADDPDNAEICTSNADCAVGACEPDTARPSTAALFCIPPTTAPSINGAAGIPGPGAIRFDATLRMCRCGNSELECNEECDDGNNANGDGCDEACRNE